MPRAYRPPSAGPAPRAGRATVTGRQPAIQSSRRRMTPSRSAHGQMSSAVDAEQVHRRLGDDRAGQQLAGPARRHARQRRALRARSSSSSRPTMSRDVRQRRGPRRRRGPRSWARRRRSGPATASSCSCRPRGRGHRPWSGRAARRAMSARTCLRSALTSAGSGGSCRCSEVAGEPAGAERQAERGVGLLVQPGGQLQRAAADVDHQQPAAGPAEPPAGGQEGQPRLVLAGRAPGGPPRSRRATRPSTVSPLGASRIALVAKASRSSHALVLGDRQALLDELAPARRRPWVDPAVAARRARTAAARSCATTPAAAGRRVGVDDEQVHGVGSHVDDPESHGSNVATGVPAAASRQCAAPLPRTEETVAAPRLAPCPRLPWTSAARGSSSPTPPMPSSATAAT